MSLLSIRFLALAFGLALVLSTSRGRAASLVFLSANLVFVWSYIQDPVGLTSMLLLCVAGWLLARWARSGPRTATVTAVALLVAAFVVLRGYGVVRAFLPDTPFLERLATAGLSFVFFKIVHVVIDSGGGTIKELRFGSYLNYCLNFTTFLMGPIQRYQDFADQWSRRKQALPATFEAHLDAVNRVLRGLVKKFVLAEALRPYVLQSGIDSGALSSGELLLGIWLFYFFLYFDFSGYCDVVIGVGALMGVRPPENFHLPFLARNVSEFWLRVHRSLTTWLTDYVFNPTYVRTLRSRALGGKPFLALSLAMMTTMIVCGMWHGTSLAFLGFGLVHGIYLVVLQAYRQLMTSRLGRKRFAAWSKHPLVYAAAVLLTFQVTSFAYVFFVLDIGEIGSFLSSLLAIAS